MVFEPGADRQAQAKAGLLVGRADQVGAGATTACSCEAQPIVALGEAGPAAATSCWCACAPTSGEAVPPGVFLPVAERFDLMRDIDRWVLARAARLLGELDRAGRSDVHLSVNLSPRSLDMEMLEVLRATLEAHDGDPTPPDRGDHRDGGDLGPGPRPGLRRTP